MPSYDMTDAKPAVKTNDGIKQNDNDSIKNANKWILKLSTYKYFLSVVQYFVYDKVMTTKIKPKT